jgi:hypothetical protein
MNKRLFHYRAREEPAEWLQRSQDLAGMKDICINRNDFLFFAQV